MFNRTTPPGQTQALCLARTDDNGSIRWFAGFGWEGQGEITSAEKWNTYLTKFSTLFLHTPYADPATDTTFKTHTLGVPADHLP